MLNLPPLTFDVIVDEELNLWTLLFFVAPHDALINGRKKDQVITGLAPDLNVDLTKTRSISEC